MKKSTIFCVLLAASVSACGEAETVVDEKAGYEMAINELKERVALIAIYTPHLDKPKLQKYDPEKRTDLDRACTFAANEVRHAANGVAQRAPRSKSPVIKALVPELEALSKTCADLEGDEEIAKCKQQVLKFDGVLQDFASKASSAGATGKFPRVSKEFITPAATEHSQLFLRAKGPGTEEAKYLAQRRDDKLDPNMLVMACAAAAGEATETFNFMGKTGFEEVRKVSAHHKAAVDGQCNRMKDGASLVGGLNICKERADEIDKDEELEKNCALACSKSKGRIHRGIPAAPFEPIVQLYDEVCKKDDGKK
jgi:hypothetical protein